MTTVENILEHHGVKGMKWGVRKQEKEAHKAWKKTAKSGETITAVYQEAARTIKPALTKLNKDPAFADIATNKKTQRQYDAVVGTIFNQHMAQASLKITAKDFGGKTGLRAVIWQHDPVTDTYKPTEHKGVRHADGDIPSFKLIRDDKGFVISVELIDDSVGHSGDVEDILAHYGVKGMKWGVRVKRSPKESPSDDAAQAASSRKRVKRSGTKALTNAELNQLVERMNLEQRYNDLNAKKPNQLKTGQAVVKGILNTGKTANEAYRLANSPLVKAGIQAATKKRR